MFRAAVIEDDPEIANVIKKRIDRTELAICSGTYDGPVSYINSPSEIKDHIVLLDIMMAEMNGLDAIPKLLSKNPDLIIIMNTIRNSPDIIFKAIEAGAVGYLDKQSTDLDYKEVFTSVLQGGAYLTPAVAYKIVTHFKSKPFYSQSLTERENDVAEKIKEGMTYAQVGDDLSISINTVRMHIKNIYTKLQINSKFELMNLGRENL